MTQVQLPKIRRKVLGDQLVDRLVALPGAPTVTVYRGQVSAAGRRPPVADSIDPPKLTDVSDVVAPYVVVFDGTGPTNLEPDLGYCNEDLRWTPTITIAAGFTEDCIQTIDRVCAWLYRWRPVLTGASTGFLEPPDGFDPGTPRPDTQVKPPRFFVSTSWRLDVTT